MSTMTLAQRNGSAEGVNPWLKATVQQFFQRVNWENRTQPPSVVSESPQASSSPADSPVPLGLNPDLTMKVSQFFEAIAWDGMPTIAASPSKEESRPAPSAKPEKSETLDDFFGSF